MGVVAPEAVDDAPGLARGRPSSADSTANEPDEHPADATAATPASDKTDGIDGIDGTATKGGTA